MKTWQPLGLIAVILLNSQGCVSAFNVTRTPVGEGKVRYDVGLVGLSNESSGPLSLVRNSDPKAMQLLPLFQFKKQDNRMQRFKEVMKNVEEMNALLNNNTSVDELGFVNRNVDINNLIAEKVKQRGRIAARNALKATMAGALTP